MRKKSIISQPINGRSQKNQQNSHEGLLQLEIFSTHYSYFGGFTGFGAGVGLLEIENIRACSSKLQITGCLPRTFGKISGSLNHTNEFTAFRIIEKRNPQASWDSSQSTMSINFCGQHKCVW
jgi:hypothetical protein